MKGVIIAGGTGSRLMPLTKVVNKSLLPVWKYPIIFYPLYILASAGIKDILIISGTGHAGQFLELLGSGKELGLNLSYTIQDKPGGIAEALGLAEDFADNKKIAAILGDNIYQDCFKEEIKKFEKEGDGARVFLKRVDDPERFGVPEIEGEKIIKIEEKPLAPKSPYAVTGLYLYDNRVWDVIKKLKPSDRGELEITDVNNFYIEDGTMRFSIVNGWWVDAGTFPSLLKANMLAARDIKELNFQFE
ncbi:MAG: spore coat protein [Parcubacteria group bacterium CG10_big_fil_rev_8_21_14_0_10_36_14]|nr:MAG: spore coat protein [Parcubacteria group bacterium CG10_big_fil_rev_8_21_14_0_10_36_14]